jgi:hypothetical protein
MDADAKEFGHVRAAELQDRLGIPGGEASSYIPASAKPFEIENLMRIIGHPRVIGASRSSPGDRNLGKSSMKKPRTLAGAF